MKYRIIFDIAHLLANGKEGKREKEEEGQRGGDREERHTQSRQRTEIECFLGIFRFVSLIFLGIHPSPLVCLLTTQWSHR